MKGFVLGLLLIGQAACSNTASTACAHVSCPTGKVCSGGVCVPTCNPSPSDGGTGCAEGQSCVEGPDNCDGCVGICNCPKIPYVCQ